MCQKEMSSHITDLAVYGRSATLTLCANCHSIIVAEWTAASKLSCQQWLNAYLIHDPISVLTENAVVYAAVNIVTIFIILHQVNMLRAAVMYVHTNIWLYDLTTFQMQWKKRSERRKHYARWL